MKDQDSTLTVSMAEKKEREKPRSRDQPLGGGMLGNYQQNSKIVILCIYSLSNVYN